MLNSKVIVINGLSRGGTNILWNILQSHPDVCSPGSETSYLLLKSRYKPIRALTRAVLARKVARHWPAGPFIQRNIDSMLYDRKLQTLSDEWNRYRTSTELYDEGAVANSVLCLKSTDKDIRLTSFFQSTWDEVHIIGLIRNGHAICDGWMRRGATAAKTGYFYRKFAEQLIQDQSELANYEIVKFEDMLHDPFKTASDLYEFSNLSSTLLSKLRLKFKK